MAKTTTTIFKSFFRTVYGYFVSKESQGAMLQDFKNAVMFSVVQLGIDIGIDAIRNKEAGADASYALTVKV
jgi:hypothetical protein